MYKERAIYYNGGGELRSQLETGTNKTPPIQTVTIALSKPYMHSCSAFYMARLTQNSEATLQQIQWTFTFFLDRIYGKISHVFQFQLLQWFCSRLCLTYTPLPTYVILLNPSFYLETILTGKLENNQWTQKRYGCTHVLKLVRDNSLVRVIVFSSSSLALLQFFILKNSNAKYLSHCKLVNFSRRWGGVWWPRKSKHTNLFPSSSTG